MPKKYPWSTAGLQKYSERLKGFIHERCTCYPEMEDDIFEVPEYMVIDPLRRRQSKFRLSFVDDFPYTRFRDNDYENETTPCSCNLCSFCDCDLNLKPFPHFVLNRKELPQWIQKDPVSLRHKVTERKSSAPHEQGAEFCSAIRTPNNQVSEKPETKKKKSRRSRHNSSDKHKKKQLKHQNKKKNIETGETTED